MILLSLNTISHFSANPVSLDIGRSRFERRQKHSFTGNVGALIPFYWTEILPGDTVSMKTSFVIRTTTPLDPVMDNLYADINYFFCPLRLIWSHLKEFFGENTTGPWYPTTTYSVPQLTFTSACTPQTIADYIGVPVGVTGISVSQFPFRAYCKIYDDWWRDENLMSPPAWQWNDSNQVYNGSNPFVGGNPYIACKFHDYFTSCLPGPLRAANSVVIPFSALTNLGFSNDFPVVADTHVHDLNGNLLFGNSGTGVDFVPAKSTGFINDVANVDALATTPKTGYEPVNQTNLVTTVNGTGTLTANSTITVNDLRMAFQMQKWYEKSALYGGRYTELLLSQFGVRSPDASLQRTEYLGGHRVPLQMYAVENNSAGTTPLGQLGAFSHTSDSSEDFTKSFTEHGILLGLLTVRYKHTYSQGISKELLRKSLFDYYFPCFANLGNMPVLRKELYADGTSADDNVFGYQEAWAEYRYSPDRLSGYMRPGISGSLASWHYGDYYSTAPTLSANWIKEDKSMVDRTLTVASTSAPQLICDFVMDPVFVRPMPVYSIPGLIDHH